ncbi:MAG: ABC-2 family transporter protein [Acetatifactor sp.]|nr:ABC-2 family transporter protein [Acetatifactor sp.]
MNVYWNYFTMNLKSQMQYKVSFLLTTQGQFLTAFTMFFGIKFMIERVGGVDDFTYGQVLLCFSVIMMSFSIGELVGGGLAVFPGMIQAGNLDRTLVRPRSIIGQVIVPNMDLSRIGLLMQALVVLCIAIPASGVRWTWLKILVLVMMTACGSVVFFCLFLCIAALSFFTIQSLNCLNILTYGMREFGQYPFSVYGKTILRLLTFVVPLALVQYYPLLYLLDRENGILYGLAPLLSLLFLIPAFLLYKVGLRNYQGTGS